MRWLRTVSRQASHSVSGVRPVRRHQPRAMLLVAVSLMVENVAFGAGAPGVGAPVGRGGVVVFLPGLRRDLRGDGDGLLGAAGGRVFWRGEDLRAGCGRRVMEAGRSGQRILPAAAGQVTRW